MWNNQHDDNSENQYIGSFDENDSYSPHGLRYTYVPQPKKTIGIGSMIAIIIAAVVLTAAAILVIFWLRNANGQDSTAASLPNGEYGGELLSMETVDGGWNVQVHIKGTPIIYELDYGNGINIGDTVYIYGDPYTVRAKEGGYGLFFEDGSELWLEGNGQWILSDSSGKNVYKDLGSWTFFMPKNTAVEDRREINAMNTIWPDTLDAEAVHFTLHSGEIISLLAVYYY